MDVLSGEVGANFGGFMVLSGCHMFISWVNIIKDLRVAVGRVLIWTWRLV